MSPHITVQQTRCERGMSSVSIYTRDAMQEIRHKDGTRNTQQNANEK